MSFLLLHATLTMCKEISHFKNERGGALFNAFDVDELNTSSTCLLNLLK